MLINPPTWTQNGEYTAEQDRRLISAIVRTEGVANSSSMVPRVVGNSRQVSIGSGGAYISGDYDNGGGGMYFSYNDGAHEVAIPVAGSVARYDLVVLRIYDSAVSGAVNEARFEVVSGTPATSPQVPAVPRSAIAIAAVRSNPGASHITANDLADQRTIAQLNGTVTGNVSTQQASRLNQLASPTNPILITAAGSANDLKLSTGGGFQSVGGSDIYRGNGDLPKNATEGSIATITSSGRTYQYRGGMWKIFSGWGPHVSLGRTVDYGHTGPYIGGLYLNGGGGTAGWGTETPKSSSDYATYFGIVGGSSGSTLSRAGGITFKRAGKYFVEVRYQVIGRVNGTGVRSRLAGPGISQFTAIDNQENYVLLGKGQEHTISTSGTIAVTTASGSTHGKIVPWLKTTAAVTLSTVLLRVEMEYEF